MRPRRTLALHSARWRKCSSDNTAFVDGSFMRVFPSLLFHVSCAILGVCSVNCAQAQPCPDQEIRINGLPLVTAKSKAPSDVLAASLEIIFQNPKVCCSKGSALEEAVQSADPASLEDVAKKVKGQHRLNDGRPITITAEYLPASSLNPDELIRAIQEKHPLLMDWNSHLYVAHAIQFNRIVDQNAAITNAIHKIFVLDARFSGEGRSVSFDRLADDWSKVQGFLMIKAQPQ